MHLTSERHPVHGPLDDSEQTPAQLRKMAGAAPRADQVSLDTVMVGNFDEKSFVRWAIFTASWRAIAL
jgi:hypothetical protein